MLAEELNKFVYLFIRYVIFQCRPQSFIDNQLILYIFILFPLLLFPCIFRFVSPKSRISMYIYHMLFNGQCKLFDVFYPNFYPDFDEKFSFREEEKTAT